MSCPDCFSGSIHEGQPKGQITKLHGLDVYVSSPPEQQPSKGIVIIVPDAFGWEFVNNRLLADHYAEKGNFTVYLPEFMNGHPAPLSALTIMPKLLQGGVWGWLTKPYWLIRTIQTMVPFMIRNRFSKSWPIVETFFKAVRENEGSTVPIGAAGFCWGGKHTVVLAHDASNANNNKPLIDAAFTGHPSLLKFPDDINKITIPTSFALAEVDMVVDASKIEQIQNAIEKQPDEKKGESKIYPATGHGFCVRADHVTKEKERAAAEAEDQAVAWFLKWFAGVKY